MAWLTRSTCSELCRCNGVVSFNNKAKTKRRKSEGCYSINGFQSSAIRSIIG